MTTTIRINVHVSDIYFIDH